MPLPTRGACVLLQVQHTLCVTENVNLLELYCTRRRPTSALHLLHFTAQRAPLDLL